MLRAYKILNDGVKKAAKDRNLLLARSIIQYYRHNFFEALCDIDAVIEIERASSGEEEPNATDELFDAYFFRGKCAYLIGDTSQAFLDFQKLILIQPKNPMVHAYAGNLLMTTGSYEDATKAFTNADSV
jgi:tetratricopeptide (TPR) repeat protein